MSYWIKSWVHESIIDLTSSLMNEVLNEWITHFRKGAQNMLSTVSCSALWNTGQGSCEIEATSLKQALSYVHCETTKLKLAKSHQRWRPGRAPAPWTAACQLVHRTPDARLPLGGSSPDARKHAYHPPARLLANLPPNLNHELQRLTSINAF